MKSRPLPVLIVAVVFLVIGLVGFIYHIKDFFEPGEKLYAVFFIQFLRVLAIVIGILLVRANNSGRWLAIAWLLSHVLISALNSITEMMAHIAILAVISILLFIPVSSAYFQHKGRLIK